MGQGRHESRGKPGGEGPAADNPPLGPSPFSLVFHPWIPRTTTAMSSHEGSRFVPRVWPMALRCSVRGVGIGLVFAAVTVGLGSLIGTVSSVGIGLVLGATLVLFGLHGAWRMADGIVTFAQAVPSDPEISAHPDGHARLEWPGLNLTVEGRAGVMGEPDLEVTAGGEPMQAPLDESAEVAREALARLGVEPTR